MKTVTDSLASLLASRSFWGCDLFVFTLVGGAGTLRLASGDCDVIDPNGDRYSCGGMTGPFLDRADSKSVVHQKLGTDADTLTFDVMPGSATVLGLPFLQAVRQGVFRGASFQLLAAYAPAPPSARSWPVAVTGTLVKFTGTVAEIDAGGTSVTFSINSMLERLQRNWPRNLYQPGCINALGDASCGVSLSAFQVAGSAIAGSTAGTILACLEKTDGYFDLGVLTFDSGVNAGLSRSVRTHKTGSPSSLALMTPFPDTPAGGDTFTLVPGCGGTMDRNGCPKFGNIANFRGFPFIPAPTEAGV